MLNVGLCVAGIKLTWSRRMESWPCAISSLSSTFSSQTRANWVKLNVSKCWPSILKLRFAFVENIYLTFQYLKPKLPEILKRFYLTPRAVFVQINSKVMQCFNFNKVSLMLFQTLAFNGTPETTLRNFFPSFLTRCVVGTTSRGRKEVSWLTTTADKRVLFVASVI